MLPLGRKNARKCTECDITCHANCAHLVPDFCGMSMETANQLLAEIQKVKAGRAAGGRTQPTGRLPRPVTQIETTPSQPGYMSPPPEAQLDGLRTSVETCVLVVWISNSYSNSKPHNSSWIIMVARHPFNLVKISLDSTTSHNRYLQGI